MALGLRIRWWSCCFQSYSSLSWILTSREFSSSGSSEGNMPSFLDLPREIRDEIYTALMVVKRTIQPFQERRLRGESFLCYIINGLSFLALSSFNAEYCAIWWVKTVHFCFHCHKFICSPTLSLRVNSSLYPRVLEKGRTTKTLLRYPDVSAEDYDLPYTGPWTQYRSRYRQLSLGLLGVNHQIREEASKIVWAKNTWQICDITDDDERHFWLARAQHLRHLVFRITDDWWRFCYEKQLDSFKTGWNEDMTSRIGLRLKSVHVKFNVVTHGLYGTSWPSQRDAALDTFADMAPELQKQYFHSNTEEPWSVRVVWPPRNSNIHVCHAWMSRVRTESGGKILSLAGFHNANEINIFLAAVGSSERATSWEEANKCRREPQDPKTT